ncbi:NDP-hexose 2,3-dehydratase family protein [Streptomyces sp. NPDC127098]|uniref:NDP-hexose 2,3-dehydratase family protein n=1 Tax=Streptomyces sp. NPDC127098 TaxID=3347137 RepID=UPI00365352F3
MTDLSAPPVGQPAAGSPFIATKIAESVYARDSTLTGLDEFHRWFGDVARRSPCEVRPIPLDDLVGWHSDPVTGDLVHDSGRFFRVEGLDVHIPDNPVPHWNQPIINQSEIGILGILVKEFDGVLHCLMQAKVEPGNVNGFQLSPTVQATRSNYTRVHRGRAVPYLEYFLGQGRGRLITDVRQSEQGSWFYRKRNRNMVVWVDEDVELLDGFRWLTLGQVHQLLGEDDLVNMDARTVLSCLPFSGAAPLTPLAAGDEGFHPALARSCGGAGGSRHTVDDILKWITEVRSRSEVTTARLPLNRLDRWHRTEYAVTHETGRFFDLVAVDVVAGGREVKHWSQPMIKPCDTGVVAFLVKRIDGVLHALVHALVEPGYLDVAELSPTVQCTPVNFDHLPTEARPMFLDEVLNAPPEHIRYDVVLSEEGGRFFHARNRYMIVETDQETEPGHPDFRWMTVHQLVDLLRHSHYVNIQARSLVACLHSLSGQPSAA